MEILPGRKGMMRTAKSVLVVSNHGDIVGGGEISLLGMVAALDRSHWAPHVVVPAEGAVAERCRAINITTTVLPMPSLRGPGLSSARSIGAFRRLIKQTGSVVMHANGSRAMCYAGLAGRLAGCPVIWHVRVADSDGALDRLLYALSSGVIVNSHAVGRRFDWTRSTKVRCIYNGVDPDHFTPRPLSTRIRKVLGLSDSAPVVVSVGRFVAYKGYGHLLEAAALVRQVMPETHWILVGEGELRRTLEERCRTEGLNDHMHFTGWVEDIRDILATGDLFVLPSLEEHFGRVLIEAMAMEKAVVATHAGGVPEIVRQDETGLLVPPAHPRAMADAVIDLLKDPDRGEQFGRAGRRLVEKEFSLSQHARAVEQLYGALSAAHAYV
ncbi:MAG: glycosyltransferase family 4 protein [Nitrospiraceae bacterium]